MFTDVCPRMNGIFLFPIKHQFISIRQWPWEISQLDCPILMLFTILFPVLSPWELSILLIINCSIPWNVLCSCIVLFFSSDIFPKWDSLGGVTMQSVLSYILTCKSTITPRHWSTDTCIDRSTLIYFHLVIRAQISITQKNLFFPGMVFGPYIDWSLS